MDANFLLSIGIAYVKFLGMVLIICCYALIICCYASIYIHAFVTLLKYLVSNSAPAMVLLPLCEFHIMLLFAIVVVVLLEVSYVSLKFIEIQDNYQFLHFIAGVKRTDRTILFAAHEK